MNQITPVVLYVFAIILQGQLHVNRNTCFLAITLCHTTQSFNMRSHHVVQTDVCF